MTQLGIPVVDQLFKQNQWVERENKGTTKVEVPGPPVKNSSTGCGSAASGSVGSLGSGSVGASLTSTSAGLGENPCPNSKSRYLCSNNHGWQEGLGGLPSSWFWGLMERNMQMYKHPHTHTHMHTQTHTQTHTHTHTCTHTHRFLLSLLHDRDVTWFQSIMAFLPLVCSYPAPCPYLGALPPPPPPRKPTPRTNQPETSPKPIPKPTYVSCSLNHQL